MIDKKLKNIINILFKHKQFFFNNKKEMSYFDLYSSSTNILNVGRLLVELKKKKKPIFFFGINESFIVHDLDSKERKALFDTNHKIFDLCFSINKGLIKDEQVRLKNFFNSFFTVFYDEQTISTKVKEVPLILERFYSIIEKLNKLNKLSINGFFFNNWSKEFSSNYGQLSGDLNVAIWRGLDTKLVKVSKYYKLKYFNKLRVLKTLDVFNNKFDTNLPGAVIFFSLSGYESFFKEFRKLGIPVICIIDKKEHIKEVDYPLFGDSTNLNVISFYCDIIKLILNERSK